MSQAVYCRTILPRESNLIDRAVAINNEVWGMHLAATTEQFRGRAQNGYLIGAFGQDGLLGTISIIELPSQGLMECTTKRNFMATWEGATGQGTFATAIPGSDTLCCVAVTNRDARRPAPSERVCPPMPQGEYADWARILLVSLFDPVPPRLQEMADRLLPAFLQSNLDPVLRFHSRDKGPLGGARVLLPVAGGRKADVCGLGYSILMVYPEVTRESRGPLLTPTAYCPFTVGEALVLAAARLAATMTHIKYVIPYSRPASYRKNLGRFIARLGGANIPFDRPEEALFHKLGRTILDA